VAHEIGRGQRLFGCAFQVEEDLRVGELPGEFMGDHQPEGGLADAAQSGQAGDGGSLACGETGEQLLEFLLAAGEVGGG